MTWSPRNRCGEDDDDDDMADEVNPNGDVPNSRLSTPDLPPNGRLTHPIERPQFNGHNSGIESNSDEGISFSDIRGEGSRTTLKKNADHKTEQKLSPAPGKSLCKCRLLNIFRNSQVTEPVSKQKWRTIASNNQ